MFSLNSARNFKASDFFDFPALWLVLFLFGNNDLILGDFLHFSKNIIPLFKRCTERSNQSDLLEFYKK